MDPEHQPIQLAAPTVAAIIEQAWLAEGVTSEEWQRMQQIGAIEERLLASGRSLDDILAEWTDKKPEEILQKYAYLASSEAVKPSSEQTSETDWLPVTFQEITLKSPRRFLYRVRLVLRGGVTEEHTQEARVPDSGLLSRLQHYKPGDALDICYRLNLKTGDADLLDVRQSVRLLDEARVDVSGKRRREKHTKF